MLDIIDDIELHGKDLYHDGIEKISHLLKRTLREAGTSFVLCKSEKVFFPAAILFDSIFDPVQNPAAIPEVYMDDEIKHGVFKEFLKILPFKTLKSFWTDCACARGQEGMTPFIDTCNSIANEIIPNLTNPHPTVELMSLVLSRITPDRCNIDVCNNGNQTVNNLSPNTTSLGTALAHACEISKKKDRPIIGVYHDEQHEFEGRLTDLFNTGQELDVDPREALMLPVDIDTSPIRNAQFQITNSTDSFGIQMADVACWCLQRFHERGDKNMFTRFLEKHIITNNFGYSQYGLTAPVAREQA